MFKKINKFHLSLFVLGLTSIISQILILREFLASFFGNEFFIGFTLFCWLFWTSLGSYLIQKVKKNISQLLSWSHILSAVFIPGLIISLRLIKSLEPISGMLPNFLPSLLWSFLLLAIPCLILGAIYTLASKKIVTNIETHCNASLPMDNRFVETQNIASLRNTSQQISLSYLIETLGFIIGGFLFSFILIWLNEILVVLIVSLLNLVTALFIIHKTQPTKRLVQKIILIALILSNLICLIFYQNINLKSQQSKFANQKIVQIQNTIYGQTIVTQTQDQYNFYQNTHFLSSDQDLLSAEIVAHLPLLTHSQPKTVALIGNGYTGVINEILKHQPEQIHYFESDKKFFQTIQKYLPDQTLSSLENEKVHIIHQDASYYLTKTRQKYDLIILNLPDPGNLNLNKYYSLEFFKLCQNILNPQGILTLHISTLPNYLTPGIKNYNTNICQTLNSVFANTQIIPIDNSLYLLALPNNLILNPQTLQNNLESRNLATNLVTHQFIEYTLESTQQKYFQQQLRNQEWITNHNLRPQAYHNYYIYWLSLFSPNFSQFINSILQPRPILYAACIIFGLILLFFLHTKNKPQNTTHKSIFTMAVAGFTLISLEIILLFTFQINFGNLYYYLSILITLLMLGLLIGTWLGKQILNKINIKSRHIILIHLVIILYLLIIPLITNYLPAQAGQLPTTFYLLFTTLIGLIVGFDYPFINHIYFKSNPLSKTGTIYSADLIGSALGAIIPSIILIPVLGINNTLVIILFFNLLVVIIWLIRNRSF